MIDSWKMTETNVTLDTIGVPNVKRKLLFLINPASGSGRAVQLFRRKVMPLLNQSSDQIEYQVLVTTARNSAFSFLNKLDIDELIQWNGIVIVSGDGLLFEVFNALLTRCDWKQAIKVPIGIIPAGSGNGLAYSISYANGEVDKDQVLAATTNVLSGKTIPIDIVKVSNSKNVYYSFLSIGWGLIADIDIESERLRILGGNRFTVWALIRTLSLRRYAGRLHFRPVPGFDCSQLNSSNGTQGISKANNKRTKSHDSIVTTPTRVSTSSSIGELHLNSSGSNNSLTQVKHQTRKSISFNFRPHQNKKCYIDSCEEAFEHCSKLEQEAHQYMKVQLTKYKRIDGDDLSENNCTSGCKDSSESDCDTDDLTPDDHLPQADPNQDNTPDLVRECAETLPDDWQTVEGNFVLVYATYQTHISHDCKIAPNAKPDDNVIWLLYLTGELTRKQVVQFLLKLDTGNHVNLPFVNLVPVQAFRLEPLSNKSRITVDGELIETETLNAEIMPCAAKILCK